MKKLLLSSACLLALAVQPAAAQTQGPELVVVRIYDGGGSGKFIITRGEAKSEQVEFQGGVTDKRQNTSSEAYYKMFSQLYREGYTLKSTFTSPVSLTTLLFVKNH